MAACGGASSAPASGSASAGDGARRLTMLVPNNTNQYIKFDEREDYPVWQELKALFAQKGLELEFEVVPADQYPTTLQTRIASGTDLPDIVCLTPFDDAAAMDLANKGTIQPVSYTHLVEEREGSHGVMPLEEALSSFDLSHG